MEPKPIPVSIKDFGFFEAIHKGKPIAKAAAEEKVDWANFLKQSKNDFGFLSYSHL